MSALVQVYHKGYSTNKREYQQGGDGEGGGAEKGWKEQGQGLTEKGEANGQYLQQKVKEAKNVEMEANKVEKGSKIVQGK